MQETDVEQMVQRLEAVLQKERREVMVYTWLTVLCTPAFVVLACLAAMVLVAWLFRGRWYDLDVADLYTGLNLFLASVLGAVLAGNGLSGTLRLDAAGFATAGVFLLLLLVTYATSLVEQMPILFDIGYGVGGLLVLGLLGRMQLQARFSDDFDERDFVPGTVVAVAGFIVSAYGELLSVSWLWVPPKPDEIRIAARVLCRLAKDPDHPLGSSTLDERMIRLLLRLKLIEVTQQQLRLTSRGTEFIRTAANAPFSACGRGD
jgi:hypothetical protein